MQLQKEVGIVTKCQRYLLHLEGLPTARINDIIVSGNGQAIIASLEGHQVQALMLNNYFPKPGDVFSRREGGLKLGLGDFLLGRSINPLGVPLDGKEPVPTVGLPIDLESPAPPVNRRRLIGRQLFTGYSLVDILMPIGCGQRELLFGDARSGKGSFILDIIASQKNRNIVCLYTALGKSEIEIRRHSLYLEESGALPYTVIIAASSTEPTPLIALAPSVALTIAEYFHKKGRDVLLVIDDLGLHAKYLREIGLLERQIPGRESYPGNIFFEHAHLMERAGNFVNEKGETRHISLLPVIETELDNFTALIPTNLMSQTDGHLLFSSLLSSQGQYPSIDFSRSVTRVGRQVQDRLQKELSSKIRRLLSNYQEIKLFSKFESELSDQTKKLMKQAVLTLELIRQDPGKPLEIGVQTALLALAFTDFLDKKEPEWLRAKKAKMVEALINLPELKTLSSGNFANLEDLIKTLEEKSMIIENYVGRL